MLGRPEVPQGSPRAKADPSLTTPTLKKARGAPCAQGDTAVEGLGSCALDDSALEGGVGLPGPQRRGTGAPRAQRRLAAAGLPIPDRISLALGEPFC